MTPPPVALMRAAGVIPLHDEEKAYAEESALLRTKGDFTRGWDRVAVMTAFKITMIEGVEVVFIVVAVGASGRGLLLPACLGALAALLLVVALGLALHRPIAMIPENTLKFLVGVLLCSFGTFWVGEGMAMSWPGSDVSLAALNVGYLAAGLLLVRLCPQGLFRRTLREKHYECAQVYRGRASWAVRGRWQPCRPGCDMARGLLVVVAETRTAFAYASRPLFVGLVAILAESAVRRAGER
jgi:Ferrous iron uptake permease, iron-lead transporter